MACMIDFAALDLRGAFDFAIMIEEDAQVRYERLAARLGRDAGGAGDVFRMMVANERKHARDLAARRDALFRRAPGRIEISVLDDGVEVPDADEDDPPRSARAALEASLAAEHRAHDFFDRAIPHVADPEVRAFFADLRHEEAEHARLLSAKLAELGAGQSDAGDGSRPESAAGRTASTDAYPDRALLRSMLPRFDVATQAVAAGVLVDGMDVGEVAEGLGVSRRTVSRKLTRFVHIARRHVAAALALASLAVCPAALAAPRATSTAEIAPARAGAAVAAPRSELAEKVHFEVAARMRRHGASVHKRLTKAILAEAELAGLDPLLVVALIHVESSFDPRAVSDAGAVGLMQLVEPTLRRELERSGLAASDPADPVTNVRAGVRYLRRLIDAFGEVDVALMAYNAGPNRIRAHMRRGGIPQRFHVYPRRVKGEMDRLRIGVGTGANPAPVVAVDRAAGRTVG